MEGAPSNKKRRTPKKLADEEKTEIVRLYKTENKSQRDLANQFQASKSQIQRVLNSVVQINSDGDNATSSTFNSLSISVGSNESIPTFSDYSDLARFLKTDASDKPKEDLGAFKAWKSSEILEKSEETESKEMLEEIIKAEQIMEDTRSEEQTFKDYVFWYIDNAKEERDQITIKYQQLELKLEDEKSKHQSLKAEMVLKENKIKELMAENANLNKGLEEAKNREKEMSERSSAEGKRNKTNVCVRCTSVTIFEYKSFPFCSINCLKETAKSLQSTSEL